MFPKVGMHTYGADELSKNLLMFGENVSRRLIRPGLRSGATVIARAMRRAVPFKSLKKAIGVSSSRRGRGIMQAKAGGGVGMKRLNIVNERKRKEPGVGMSSRNIHWYTLGTKARYTGSVKSGRKQKATGNTRMFRGRMPRNSVLRRAAMGAIGPANFAIRNMILKGINREWAKRQKKMGSRF